MRILVYHATINQHMLAKPDRSLSTNGPAKAAGYAALQTLARIPRRLEPREAFGVRRIPPLLLGTVTRLRLASILLCAAALSGQGAESKVTAPQKAPANAKKSGQTVLFLTWENVFKGRLEPMIDPARLSDSGRKVMEGLQTSWNRRFETNGHGTKMMMAPRGIRISVEKAQKELLPLKADCPWETRLDGFSILREGPLLKCWYSVHVPKQKEEFLFQNGRAIETGGTAMCYAESTNGFHWTKPNLGVFSFNGSKENNIVSYANFIASVFHDEHGLPEERYKSFEFGKLPPDELAKSPGGNMNTYCLYAGSNIYRITINVIVFKNNFTLVNTNPQ